jgi:transposase
MFMQGKSIDEIAKERGYSKSTIFTHLSRFVINGKLSLDRLVKKENVEAIKTCLNEHPGFSSFSEIKEALPQSITFEEIRLVREITVTKAYNTVP